MEQVSDRGYGGCEGPDAMYVKLISSDGHEFIVKREHALTSGTIKGQHLPILSLRSLYLRLRVSLQLCFLVPVSLPKMRLMKSTSEKYRKHGASFWALFLIDFSFLSDLTSFRRSVCTSLTRFATPTAQLKFQNSQSLQKLRKIEIFFKNHLFNLFWLYFRLELLMAANFLDC